jgi:hypothetical protein
VASLYGHSFKPMLEFVLSLMEVRILPTRGLHSSYIVSVHPSNRILDISPRIQSTVVNTFKVDLARGTV